MKEYKKKLTDELLEKTKNDTITLQIIFSISKKYYILLLNIFSNSYIEKCIIDGLP